MTSIPVRWMRQSPSGSILRHAISNIQILAPFMSRCLLNISCFALFGCLCLALFYQLSLLIVASNTFSCTFISMLRHWRSIQLLVLPSLKRNWYMWSDKSCPNQYDYLHLPSICPCGQAKLFLERTAVGLPRDAKHPPVSSTKWPKGCPGASSYRRPTTCVTG